MNDYAFGNFLYTLRTEQGLSQAQLGDQLGVTNKAVSKWENGTAKPNTKLLPDIAAILGVTVEELFAGRRLEKNSDYAQLKDHLLGQKRKYAVCASAFLAAVAVIPLLLIWVVCVVMGFAIPDEVLGPIASMGCILAFVSSLVAYMIYRNNFRSVWIPERPVYTADLARRVKGWLVGSMLTWSLLLALLYPVYLAVRALFTDLTANVVLAIYSAVLIGLLGVVVYWWNIKRLLKIKSTVKRKRHRLVFRELPPWGKVCYVTVIGFVPVVVLLRRAAGVLSGGWVVAWILCQLLWLICLVALLIYNRKQQ